MRRGECWGRWDVLGDRIVVHGTKSHAADRIVPLVLTIIRPRIGHWESGQALRKATDGTVRPHDARHSSMHWMELARIPRIRRKLYVGHATVHDVSDLYEEHEVQGFLAEDRERLQRFLGEQPGRLLTAI